MKIQIIPYREEWVQMFLEEKARLEQINGLEAKNIEHVGSTSIPGQAAKPVVDIFVGVKKLMPLNYYINLLQAPRYRYTETDMEGRWLFGGYEDGVWKYNIHLLPVEGFYNRTEFIIRDFLRNHPDYVEEYGEIKRECARAEVDAMAEYTRAKTAFLQKVYDTANEEKGFPKRPVWEGDNNPLNER